MDLENMIFSEEDKNQLKENRNKINAWIMENIVPSLAPDERIYVDYGGEYKARMTFETTTRYHFAVYGSETNFYSGGGTESKGHVGVGEKYGGISHALQTVGSPYELYPIVENWTYIKSCLVNEANARANAKKSIQNFVV